MQKVSQRGFALVELLLVLVIVGIIAFVAWRVIEATGDAQTAQNQAAQTTVPIADSAPVVNKASDLDTLETELNNAKIDDNSTAELDSQTTF